MYEPAVIGTNTCDGYGEEVVSEARFIRLSGGECMFVGPPTNRAFCVLPPQAECEFAATSNCIEWKGTVDVIHHPGGCFRYKHGTQVWYKWNERSRGDVQPGLLDTPICAQRMYACGGGGAARSVL